VLIIIFACVITQMCMWIIVSIKVRKTFYAFFFMQHQMMEWVCSQKTLMIFKHKLDVICCSFIVFLFKVIYFTNYNFILGFPFSI